ncbi:ABC transporter permease [Tetzosporium hominis]|uniref:ABC transporter permease n=1 Tax=Tetzosporium hominis TaxID=2020506 RepID=A0A264W261_9BACL|nr:iron ABC transporter permease [Tetzosporium hominis]OZS77672.1 ABC transporter permease [Tetzosporium hominis]
MIKRKVGWVASILLLLASIWLGISVGAVQIPLSTIWGGSEDATATTIVWNIRMPRVFLAALVGAALAVAGAAFQALLKNPLADPYTLGVSSGASVGAVATIFFGISLPVIGMYTLPLLSMIGAIATLLIVVSFARMIDRSLRMETIILTGIITSSFFGAMISLMIALTGEELRQIIGWLLGSVALRTWTHVQMIAPFVVIAGAWLLVRVRDLNALQLGEDRAHHLGVNVSRVKNEVLIAGSMLTGAAVAVSGTIGFVGLVVPHMVRQLFGADNRHVLPLSMINGASLLILCDLVARTIIEPTELPIGVMTAFIGAPVFAWIFFRQRRKGVK